MRRLLIPLVIALLLPLAGASAQRSGYHVVDTPHDFPTLEKRVRAAVEGNGLYVVTRASASDGARGRGITIPGDAVYGVFRNDFALRMLKASPDAGIEAPLRLHLVEEAGGGTSIRWYDAAAVFAPYQGEGLQALSAELDALLTKIVADAAAP